jgi:hypothetical protein
MADDPVHPNDCDHKHDWCVLCRADRMAVNDPTIPTIAYQIFGDQPPSPNGHGDLPETWQPVNLRQIQEHGLTDPPPTILRRDDGHALLYPAAINMIYGEPEAGKTWLALIAAAQTIQDGEPVTYIDLEDNPARLTARLTALGCEWAHIHDYFTYIRPHEHANDAVLAHLTNRPPTLLIIDALTEYLTLHGLNLNDNTEVSQAFDYLPRQTADAGTCICGLDHVTKSQLERGRFAIGAQHKLAAVSGAAYSLWVREPFGRGQDGWARILINKDRPGHIRGEFTEEEIGANGKRTGRHIAGEFFLNAHNDQLEHKLLGPVNETNLKRVNQRTQLVTYIHDNPGLATTPLKNGFRQHIGGIGAQEATNLLKQILAAGLVRTEPKGTGTLWYPAEPKLADNLPDPW